MTSKLGSDMPTLDANGSMGMRNGNSMFNPPNPNSTITNFNSGVNVQASLDEPQAVELGPQLGGKKKVKKVKKAKKKENYLNLDDDNASQAYGSLGGAKVEHSALQSMSLVDANESTNPQDNVNGGMMPLDFDPNSNEI